MRVRSTYFKVSNMAAELAFWRALLQMEPLKEGSHWSEFMIGSTRMGFLLNDFGEQWVGASCVPVLEVDEGAMPATVARAKAAGASVVLDGLADPKMNSIVMASPDGHEFELCNCKTHD